MDRNLKVVTFNIRCVWKGYGDGINGFVVPTHSAEALAEKLKMLLTDSALYKRMCENSLEIFKQTFTAEKYAENIEKIYHELGGKK